MRACAMPAGDTTRAGRTAPRRYTDHELVEIVSRARNRGADAPRHLVTLISDLNAFTDYATQCLTEWHEPEVYDRLREDVSYARAQLETRARAPRSKRVGHPAEKNSYKICTNPIDNDSVLYIIEPIQFRRVYNFVMQSSLSSVLPPEVKLSSPAAAGDTPFYSRCCERCRPCPAEEASRLYRSMMRVGRCPAAPAPLRIRKAHRLPIDSIV